MLLDDLMPHYDVVERHRTVVRAPPRATYTAIRQANLAGAWIARVLLALRTASLSPRLVRLDDFERSGFHIIAEDAPEELVIGLVGRFWTARGGLCDQLTPDTFRAGPPAGQALAGWNFTVAKRRDGTSDLRTETRVLCAPDARWKFRLYWLVVRPGSGIIRRAMLRAIRKHAERTLESSKRASGNAAAQA